MRITISSTASWIRLFTPFTGMTDKEVAICAWIADRTQGAWFVPGKQFKDELCQAMGIRPPSAAYHYMATLTAKHALVRDANRYRVIRKLIPPTPLPNTFILSILPDGPQQPET